MHGDDVRNSQFGAQEHGGVPARQRGMSMDEVNAPGSLQFAHSTHDPGEQERTRGRQTETSRQRQIAEPFRRHTAIFCAKLCSVKRLHCKDRVHDASLGKGIQWLRNEATRGIIVLRGIKRSQREHVKRLPVSRRVWSR
jgi:hypothetical protein